MLIYIQETQAPQRVLSHHYHGDATSDFHVTISWLTVFVYLLMCINILPIFMSINMYVHMYVCTACVCLVHGGSEEGTRSSRTGHKDGCELTCML